MIAMLPVAWREALEELSRRKLRTLLTLLGLIFGIGAIVAMQAVGEGSRREALRLVQGVGARVRLSPPPKGARPGVVVIGQAGGLDAGGLAALFGVSGR